ncbi:unnamed protein product [Orchesella dallaii]|uniref:Retrotransposon gag domain-containing protein n=1 Tax=Orchesella dallaii TaxID=48710 RepID=A0ABP1S6Y2_9HEXA
MSEQNRHEKLLEDTDAPVTRTGKIRKEPIVTKKKGRNSSTFSQKSSELENPSNTNPPEGTPTSNPQTEDFSKDTSPPVAGNLRSLNTPTGIFGRVADPPRGVEKQRTSTTTTTTAWSDEDDSLENLNQTVLPKSTESDYSDAFRAVISQPSAVPIEPPQLYPPFNLWTGKSLSKPIAGQTDKMDEEMEQKIQKAIHDEMKNHFLYLRGEREKDRQQLKDMMDIIIQQNEIIKSKDANTAAAMADAFKGLTLTTMTCNIDPPKFDIKKMTPEAFLAAAENHFASMAYDKTKYLTHVKSLLPEGVKSWYNHELPTFKTWTGFKVAFGMKYDGWKDKEKRRKELERKQQQLNQPTEKFIYEVMDLSKQCFPGDTVEDHLKRAQGALHPTLRVGVGPHFFDTAIKLIQACDLATSSIEAQDMMWKREFSVPPMKASDRKGFTDKPKTNEQKQSNESKPTSGQEIRGGRGQLRGQSRGDFRGGNRGNGRGGYNFQRGGRGRFHSRGGYNAATNSQRDTRNDGTPAVPPVRGRGGPRGASGRGRMTGYKYNQKMGRVNTASQLEKCLRCLGYNHSIENCPSPSGLALAYLEDGSVVQIELPEDFEANETVGSDGVPKKPLN